MKRDGEWLSRAMIVVAGSLCAHSALAAGLAEQAMAPLAAPIATESPVPASEAPLPEATPMAAAVSVSESVPPVPASEIECVAKVIRHEAANQPVVGQTAVAQVIRTRMKDGRFPRTACGVVKQRGQFFDVDAYAPARDDARWTTAMEIAAHTLSGRGEDVAEGALFFHAPRSAMPGRTRVVRIADHTFYR